MTIASALQELDDVGRLELVAGQLGTSKHVDQMRLANALCRFAEQAAAV